MLHLSTFLEGPTTREASYILILVCALLKTTPISCIRNIDSTFHMGALLCQSTDVGNGRHRFLCLSIFTTRHAEGRAWRRKSKALQQ